MSRTSSSKLFFARHGRRAERACPRHRRRRVLHSYSERRRRRRCRRRRRRCCGCCCHERPDHAHAALRRDSRHGAVNGVSSRGARCEQARFAARGGGDSSSSRAEDSVGPTHYLHYASNWIGAAAGAGLKHSLSSLQDVSNWIGVAAGAGPILIAPRHTNPYPSQELLLDPGAGASLCFDYINNGSCTRLRTGGACKCRE